MLLAAHILGLLAAWLNPLEPWVRLALSTVVLAHLWGIFRKQPSPWSVEALRLLPDGGWRLYFVNGQERDACLLATSIYNPWFVLMHLRSKNHHHEVLICRDSLAPEAFRQLRVVLRIMGSVDKSSSKHLHL